MINRPLRIVVDTNVLLSFLIKRDSTPGNLVTQVLQHHQLLLSLSTANELTRKCAKTKFRSYFTQTEGDNFVRLLEQVAEIVTIHHRTTICRDPKDNCFLELALSGRADLIVSGDWDLLILGAVEGIPILSPREAITRIGNDGNSA